MCEMHIQNRGARTACIAIDGIEGGSLFSRGLVGKNSLGLSMGLWPVALQCCLGLQTGNRSFQKTSCLKWSLGPEVEPWSTVLGLSQTQAQAC